MDYYKHKYELRTYIGQINNRPVYYDKDEGYSRCLLESLACGVPAVSNNCPYGPSEMLGDSKYGLLTNNKEEFVKATKYLLNNEKAYNQYKIKAKLRSKDFDIKNIVKEWEKILSGN